MIHFNEFGKRKTVNNNNSDPTNYAGRVAAAQAEYAEFYRRNPDGWAGTRGCQPQNDIERRALADAATAANRDLTFAEKMQIIERLRQR